MSYEFIKLSEVEKVDTSYNANLLIEENGEIKRLSTENINFGGSGNQVQADWNETDDTSPAFIANKPSVVTEVYNFSIASGGIYLNGSTQTLNTLKKWWDSGADLRVVYNFVDCRVVTIDFRESSGTVYEAYVGYFRGDGSWRSEKVINL